MKKKRRGLEMSKSRDFPSALFCSVKERPLVVGRRTGFACAKSGKMTTRAETCVQYTSPDRREGTWLVVPWYMWSVWLSPPIRTVSRSVSRSVSQAGRQAGSQSRFPRRPTWRVSACRPETERSILHWDTNTTLSVTCAKKDRYGHG